MFEKFRQIGKWQAKFDALEFSKVCCTKDSTTFCFCKIARIAQEFCNNGLNVKNSINDFMGNNCFYFNFPWFRKRRKKIEMGYITLNWKHSGMNHLIVLSEGKMMLFVVLCLLANFFHIISGLVTNSILFCWLFTIKGQCKKVHL